MNLEIVNRFEWIKYGKPIKKIFDQRMIFCDFFFGNTNKYKTLLFTNDAKWFFEEKTKCEKTKIKCFRRITETAFIRVIHKTISSMMH